MLKDKFLLLGVAGVAAVATAGWMRTPQAVPAVTGVSAFQPPVSEYACDPQQPVSSVLYATAPVRQFSAPAQAAGGAPVASARRQEPLPVPTAAVRRAPVAYDDRGATVTKTRSKKASAAIIGGSAAAGAAIGGLAGGGKGAIIGAVAGAGAGTVYDRMTHKKEVPAAEDDNYRYRSTGTESRQGRSTMQSAAIVGGGAAAGAAIGGAAGGGKGAAIGALTGGAAGYAYDRMTRNR